MKKKASLLISGITTVAMLAVAVGSFAAWNQLSDSTEVFAATTDTPTVLEISEVVGFTAGNTLAPTTTVAADLKDVNDVQELTATFKPTLTESATSSKVTYKIDTTGSANDLFTTYLDAKLYDESSNVVAADAELTSGTKYTLKVTFKPAYADGDNAIWTKDARDAVVTKDIKVKVTCTAEKTTPVA